MKRFVTFGEIMLRLSTPGYRRYVQAMPGSLDTHFGGAEASVAGLLAHWGGSASYVTALPDNPIGRACLANLRALGIDTASIVLSDDSRMGLYFVEHGVNQRGGNVIYDRVDSAFALTPPERYAWDEVLTGANWFVTSGISPAVSAAAAAATRAALEKAREHGVPIACDVNYRSKLWRWDPDRSPQQLARETMQEMVAAVDLLVCGRGDAVEILGLAEDVGEDDLPFAVSESFPNLKRIAITRRRSHSSNDQMFAASLFDVASGKLHSAPVDEPYYRIADVVDRIGTGDAFLAALLYALETPEWSAPERAIQWATATACLAHSIEGDFSWIAPQEVRALVESRGIGRISR
jgi:2-dehydro-3-deoxygluconokinase